VPQGSGEHDNRGELSERLHTGYGEVEYLPLDVLAGSVQLVQFGSESSGLILVVCEKQT
jgi:hypothetical protein